MYIRIPIKVNGYRVVIIIDLKVTSNFISRTVAQVINLLTREKKE